MTYVLVTIAIMASCLAGLGGYWLALRSDEAKTCVEIRDLAASLEDMAKMDVESEDLQ